MQCKCVCLVACVLSFAAGAKAEEASVTVRPADTGTALAKPGMGWAFHYYDNVPAHYGSKLAPSDTLDDWPGLTVVYFRIPWSYVEPGGFPAITLKDRRGGIAGVFVDGGLDVCSLPVGAPDKAESRQHQAAFDLPFQLFGGEYEVFFSVGTLMGSPAIALPLPGDDGQRRYRLGMIQVTGDYGVAAGALKQREGRYVLPLHWTTHRVMPDDVRPFCHFDRDGQIAFQGRPESDDALPALRAPGSAEVNMMFTRLHVDESGRATWDAALEIP